MLIIIIIIIINRRGAAKGSRGSKDQLLIDKAILKNWRRRLTNLSMAWIDYKKAYDMVLHSWILKCLEMVGAANNMISIISNSMVNWKTVLTSGGMALGQVDIRRGIFQGDFLSPLLFIVIMLPLTLVPRKMRAGYKLAKDMKPINYLLFMDDLKLYGASKDKQDSLVQVVRTFLQDINMSFGLDKCAVLEMGRGRQVGRSGIELPDDQHIGEIIMIMIMICLFQPLAVKTELHLVVKNSCVYNKHNYYNLYYACIKYI